MTDPTVDPAPAPLVPDTDREHGDEVGPRRSGAISVAAGIFLSRLAGLVRQRVIAHYFGLGVEADAWSAAFRIPNVLQNLFGDQALSASFIPVYASLLARGERRTADRVAGAVGALLAVIVALLVVVGVLATPWLIALIAPGFTGAKRELTTTLVRILFPGVGLLVLSAWCLAILNSHHRFLLSYTAPIAWNAAMIATLLIYGGGTSLPRLAEILAWGSVVGSALQFAVQLPVVLRVASGVGMWAGAFSPAIAALNRLRQGYGGPPKRSAEAEGPRDDDAASEHVRTITGNFFPVFISRGVVQISSYVDQLLASLLGTGAVAAITNAQTLSTLPVSLFGMAVSAAELPAMSGIGGDENQRYDSLRRRLDAGLRRIAFFVVPSAMAFLAFGDVVAAALFQTGRFTHGDAEYVWGILAGSAVGLLASTLGRLYASTYYALRDTRTPLNYAIVRVMLTTVLGYFFALPLPRLLGVPPAWGAAGLTASAGIAGWVEMLLLRATLNARIGRTGLPARYAMKLWLSAATAAAVAWGIKQSLPPLDPLVVAAIVFAPYGLVFFEMTAAMRVPEASAAWSRFKGRFTS